MNHDPKELCRRFGLVYVETSALELRRQRRGRGFCYRDGSGKAVGGKALKARIRQLAVPPAWTEVCIAADDRAHIQAIWRDAEGRLQYRYHPDWDKARATAKEVSSSPRRADRKSRPRIFGPSAPRRPRLPFSPSITAMRANGCARRRSSPPLTRSAKFSSTRAAWRGRATSIRANRGLRGRQARDLVAPWPYAQRPEPHRKRVDALSRETSLRTTPTLSRPNSRR